MMVQPGWKAILPSQACELYSLQMQYASWLILSPTIAAVECSFAIRCRAFVTAWYGGRGPAGCIDFETT